MSAPVKLFGKDLSEYATINVEELLCQLSPEEIEEIGQELIDPDDSMVPPSDRCRYNVSKQPTGPYKRKALIDFLERKAKEEKDWDEIKPYSKEIRGKVYTPPTAAAAQSSEIECEWDEELESASAEEIADLAAILGFHGMLNQVQYHRAFVDNQPLSTDSESGGFQGVAKHETFKLVKEEPPIKLDINKMLERVKSNDPDLKELNLNNMKELKLAELCEFAEALKNNTNIESVEIVNTRATDKVAKALSATLKENRTIKSLNLESNYISGVGILALLESVNVGEVVTEFRVANQRPQVLGVKVETKIAALIQDNTKLMKFGIFMKSPDARLKVQEAIKRNNDSKRKDRIADSS